MHGVRAGTGFGQCAWWSNCITHKCIAAFVASPAIYVFLASAKSSLIWKIDYPGGGVDKEKKSVFTTILAMAPSPTKKTRKPRIVKAYACKPGPKGRNSKNRPATSAQPLKKSKPRLTNNDWLEVYQWVDDHPHKTQAEVVNHFKSRPEGALLFDQGSLSRNLRKRTQREAEVEENPAALSSKRARIVTRPDVDQALWMWVKDRMSKSRTVSGPELSEKRKIFEEKFQVPEAERLSETGWQQAFYRRLDSPRLFSRMSS